MLSFIRVHRIYFTRLISIILGVREAFTTYVCSESIVGNPFGGWLVSFSSVLGRWMMVYTIQYSTQQMIAKSIGLEPKTKPSTGWVWVELNPEIMYQRCVE